ncbi:MAG: hypothetical protein A2506_05945 [Elusimicrobia bacterium RIFOXYD12_FULL_66_9]|nr:MAG: hypothetical protein A2506_05945 [Elusimicrobia bacterium RIFOXYD12_FULL_66_9]
MKTILLAVLLVPGATWAAETASFLTVGAGARALGMGGAYSALGEDADSLYWNPAGLARLERKDVAASHTELFAPSRHDYLAYAHPTTMGTFAGAFTYLSQGSLDGRDALGHPTGSYQASDSAASFGYARKTEWADLGASIKYLRSHIGSTEAQGAALDLGARRSLDALVVGLAARNIGPGLKYENQRNDLPLRLAAGAAYKLVGGHAVVFELTNGPRGAGTDAAFGGEYQPMRNVMLRGGYTTQSAGGGSGFEAARGLTLGIGVTRERWRLDYAVLPMGELGTSHRFSLGGRF